MLYGLDLFSGIGGMSFALKEWVRPVAYCEIEPYCQTILLQRMQKGDLSKAPIWDDIRTIPYWDLPKFDIMYGGFPCQDISIATHGKGLDGKRSGLYWEIHKLAKTIKPQFIFLENVPAILTRGAWEIVSSLANEGYECRWDVISAREIGADHERKRWFALAYSKSPRWDGGGNEERNEKRQSFAAMPHMDENWKKNEPPLVGVVDGVPNRMDRIKALGNSVVPLQAKVAFENLMGLKIKR